MKKDKIIHLHVWDEIIGKLLDVSSDDYTIQLNIDGKIVSFPRELFGEKNLIENLLSKKIAVLRTDFHKKPYLFRIIE